MEFKDYYKIMGLKPNATLDEVKKSYRRLARKYHPDVSKEPDAERNFKEVGEAYEVLKNPEKRASYDQLAAKWKSGQDFNLPPGWDAGYEYRGAGSEEFSGVDSAVFSDFFESLFGHNQQRSHAHQKAGAGHSNAQIQMKGQDHHATVLIDLEDAFHGAVREINLQSPQIDPQGYVINKTRSLKVKIPKGVKQGQQIRLTGQGEPGTKGGANGDLYLKLEFREHPFYSVVGHDLYLKLPLAPWEAALGAKIKVPTPTGQIELTIPADSGSDGKLRLKARGIPAKTPGDLYVILQIVLPPGTDPKAKALYQQMQQQVTFNPRANLGV